MKYVIIQHDNKLFTGHSIIQKIDEDDVKI